MLHPLVVVVGHDVLKDVLTGGTLLVSQILDCSSAWDGSVGRMGGWATGTLGLAAFLALGAAALVMIGWLEGDLVLFHNSLSSRL